MQTIEYPNLSGIAGPEDVSQKGAGSFTADYINWARISQYLRDHAAGWLPKAHLNASGDPVHIAPDGSAYLMIGFVHPCAGETPPVIHAIMNNRMQAMKKESVSSRDISDAFVRGMCKSAALTFGLAWQLWSKDDPLNRDEPSPEPQRAVPPKPKPSTTVDATPVRNLLLDTIREWSNTSKEESIKTTVGILKELNLPTDGSADDLSLGYVLAWSKDCIREGIDFEEAREAHIDSLIETITKHLNEEGEDIDF